MKLAIFYHTRLDGGQNPPLNPDVAMPMMAEQMAALRESGLEEASREIHIVSNGGAGNLLLAAALAPDKSILHDNGPAAESHLPTVNYLRAWLPTHPDWYVCYFHLKGVTHPGERLYHHWRKCMESAVIWKWRTCVSNLEAGLDSVGAHWLTPERYPGTVKSPFWGGMFFWARAEFLLTLPALPEAPRSREDWFLSEGWIGSGPQRPRVFDFSPHWPSLVACHP